MKKTILMMGIAALAVIFASCGSKTKIMEHPNPLTEQEKAGGLLTPEILWKLGRIGGFSLSPDGRSVVYAVTYSNMAENVNQSSLWLIPAAGGEAKRITDDQGKDSDPCWSADGKHVYFMSDRGGKDQMWSVNPETGALKQLSSIEGGITGFGIAPQGGKAYYTKKVEVEKVLSSEIFPDMDKSQAYVYDDLMVRHWNYWNKGLRSHIFITDFDGGLKEGRDILEGERWDAPMAHEFDGGSICWNNAGTKLAYTCKKVTGAEYALNTDSDIYVYDVASGQTENITQGMVGYDKYPVFSPDDSKIAFLSMERPGNESDKNRLFVYDTASGDKSYLTSDFDYNAEPGIYWEGGQSILFISAIEGTYQLCRVGLAGGVEVLTRGEHNISAISMAGGAVVCQMSTLSSPAELYGLDLSTGSLSTLTRQNAEFFDNIKMGEVQKRWIKTTDGKQMMAWVTLPPGFDPSQKYPAILHCQGGPQSVVANGWGYRWNPQIMAANGYIVVSPSRRGVPSFGQEWVDQISGDWSGQNIRDLLAAIDDVAREPWCDQTRLACVGASYGGYSSFFLAGHHEKRFKAFIAHCGVFNHVSMYGETEELFFTSNEMGGPYWSDNAVAKRSYANSPHMFVQKWDTPILIITGVKDYRVSFNQSLEAFTAARVLGIPSKLVVFQDEGHHISKPQNAIVWQREFFAWLDKYVKNGE